MQSTLTSASDNCPKCKGSGFIFFTDDKGYEKARACDCQKQRLINARLEASGFPFSAFNRMTLDTFRTENQDQANMKAVAERFIKEGGYGLGFFGKSGTGKTHLCVAVCQELVRRDMCSFVYMPYRSAIRELRSEIFNDIRYCELMSRYIDVSVLLIDDMLKFSQNNKGEVSQDELRILYEIINERYLKGRITVISSEYTGKQIMDMDVALGSRIVEMLGENGYRCGGSNYRLKKGVSG